jgi:hypothetical protein
MQVVGDRWEDSPHLDGGREFTAICEGSADGSRLSLTD